MPVSYSPGQQQWWKFLCMCVKTETDFQQYTFPKKYSVKV